MGEDPLRFAGGINPYSYVKNDATDFVDPNGLLQVCCRSAHQALFKKLADLTLQPEPCHCFLKTSDGHTYGGYFSWSLGTFGDLVTNSDDNTDSKRYKNEADCKNVMGVPCSLDAQVKQAFGSSPKNLGAYGLDPFAVGTSNDAAVLLLKESGVSYTLPACAWGKGSGTYHPMLPPGPFPPWPLM